MARSERIHAERGCRFRRIDGAGFRVAFEVTRRCNLSCRHCFLPPAARQPSTGEVLSVARQAADLRGRKVIVTGGEPLLRDDLERIIEEIVRADMLADLNSNLLTLTRPRATALRDAGLQEASVSLYGNAQVHDGLTQVPGAFVRTLEKIDLLRDLGVTVDVHGAIWDAMLPSVAELVRTVEQHGVSSMSFFSLLPPHARAEAPTFALHPEQAFKAVEHARAVAEIPVRTVGLIPPRRDECTMAGAIFGIDADLRLKPCLLSSGCEGVDLRTLDLAAGLAVLRRQVEQGQWRPACFPLGSPWNA